MKIYLCFYGILLTALCALSNRNHDIYPWNETLELQMVNIVFRHGDRTPDKNSGEMYPTDPNINHDFNPEGYGALTNNGKKRAYLLGKYLRKRYDKFLGSTYLPEDVAGINSNYDRTQMTLLLVLAGLYPPDKDQKWNEFLNWQPIPINYGNRDINSLLLPTNCPRFKELEAEIRELPEIKELSSKFSDFWTMLTELSGKSITNSESAFDLYNTLITELAMNLPIPEWAQGILDNELKASVKLQIKILNYNETVIKLNGGKLLREMQDNMNARIKNESFKRGKKINLYSAHDINVAAHLQTLGVAEPHQPYFASAVIIELYRDSQKKKHYIQVLYRRGDTEKVHTIQIPHCSLKHYGMCEFYKFKKLMKEVTPTDDELQCT